MPEMDGLETAHLLRELPAVKDASFVLLTSIGMQELQPSTRDAMSPFAAVVTKPANPDRLRAEVARSLGAVDQRPKKRAKSAIDQTLAARRPLRILIAEDNHINQKVALKMLERMGYRADVVSNGAEAVEAVGRQVYDVVLMDVQMPEMDGIEATRRIAAGPPARQPRIIAMTANVMEEDRERCLAAGMQDFLRKPVSVKELADALPGAATRGVRARRRLKLTSSSWTSPAPLPRIP